MMKSVVLVLLMLVASPALAGGTRKVKKVYIPTVGKESYTTQHPGVVRPGCKNGKCPLQK
jgi:hypothetical protein